MYVGGIVCGPVPTIAKTNALDGTWVGFIGTTCCKSATEKWEMRLTAELLKSVRLLLALYNNVVFTG